MSSYQTQLPPLWWQGRVRGSRGGVAACLALFLMNFDVLCDDADEQEVDAVRPSMSTSESQCRWAERGEEGEREVW